MKIDVSVVIPCLNEEKTIATCIHKAKEACKKANIKAEIIVVDNRSEDNSARVAKQAGAKVIFEGRRGYGRALRTGFAAAKGTFLFMADGDNTYDFSEIPRFYTIAKQEQVGFVIGNRFTKRLEQGAMPWSHKYIGNPALTFLLRRLFGGRIKDSQCGMRLIAKQLYDKLNLQSDGMEFASEMLIKALKKNVRIKQTSIAYYKRTAPSKLNTLRDGWRHLRFMLLFSPNTTFFVPGLLFTLLGTLILGALYVTPVQLGGITFYIHPLLLGSILVILGAQLLFTGYYARVFAIKFLGEQNKFIQRIQQNITLEKGLLLGSIILLFAVAGSIAIINRWIQNGFGALDEIKLGIILLTIGTVGLQIIFNSFYFVSIELLSKEE